MKERRIVEKRLLDEMLFLMEKGEIYKFLIFKKCRDICGHTDAGNDKPLPVHSLTHNHIDGVFRYIKDFGGNPLFKDENCKLFEIREKDGELKLLPLIRTRLTALNGTVIYAEDLLNLSMREMFDVKDYYAYFSAYAQCKDGTEYVLGLFDNRTEMIRFMDNLRANLDLLPKANWAPIADDLICNTKTNEFIWIDAPKDAETFTVKGEDKVYKTFDSIGKACAYLREICYKGISG